MTNGWREFFERVRPIPLGEDAPEQAACHAYLLGRSWSADLGGKERTGLHGSTFEASVIGARRLPTEILTREAIE